MMARAVAVAAMMSLLAAGVPVTGLAASANFSAQGNKQDAKPAKSKQATLPPGLRDYYTPVLN